MRGKFFVRAICVLMIAAFLGACSSTTSVSAEAPVEAPAPGATVSVNNPPVRQTPVVSTAVSNVTSTRSNTRVTDTTATDTIITTEASHSNSLEAILDIKVRPLVGGVFVWPLFLWDLDIVAFLDEVLTVVRQQETESQDS